MELQLDPDAPPLSLRRASLKFTSSRMLNIPAIAGERRALTDNWLMSFDDPTQGWDRIHGSDDESSDSEHTVLLQKPAPGDAAQAAEGARRDHALPDSGAGRERLRVRTRGQTDADRALVPAPKLRGVRGASEAPVDRGAEATAARRAAFPLRVHAGARVPGAVALQPEMVRVDVLRCGPLEPDGQSR